MNLSVVMATIVTAFLGGLLGFGIRLHEVIRQERKLAYLAYLRALDKLPHAFLEAHIVATTGQPPELSLDASMSVAEAEAEMTITASRRVLRSSSVLRAVIQGPRLVQLMAEALGTRTASSSDERELREIRFLSAYWQLISPYRVQVVDGMRRDLHIRRLPHKVHGDHGWV